MALAVRLIATYTGRTTTSSPVGPSVRESCWAAVRTNAEPLDGARYLSNRPPNAKTCWRAKRLRHDTLAATDDGSIRQAVDNFPASLVACIGRRVR
jgi:hypothetical protein